MELPSQAALLRIFTRERARGGHGRPLYEQIVLKARERQLAGATVLRGGGNVVLSVITCLVAVWAGAAAAAAFNRLRAA